MEVLLTSIYTPKRLECLGSPAWGPFYAQVLLLPFQTLSSVHQAAAPPLELPSSKSTPEKACQKSPLLGAAQVHAYRLLKTWQPYLSHDSSPALLRVTQELLCSVH